MLEIKIVDGIPCIVADIFGYSSFTDIQYEKEQEFHEEIIKELKELFSV